MKYIVYCRKSSEAEERQALSIESQKSEIFRTFKDQPDTEIVEVLEEAKSAKAPGRPIFNTMIERIKLGEAEGIIAWHPDRLARNSVDGGLIIYLLDQRIVQDMKFVNYSFENSSQGKFMLQIMFGYSKYYVDNLSENVKRGNRAKLEKGWRPNGAPIGYLNDKESRTVKLDPERAPLVRHILQRGMTGMVSLNQLVLEAKALDLRTRSKTRGGTFHLSRSTIHRMLQNPFYAGRFEWNGIMYEGAHTPLITMAEFDAIRRNIGRQGKSGYEKHGFTYTGLISCGECGMSVTAETQTNRHGTAYHYYHCTRRRRDYRCRQPFVRREYLEEEFRASLGRINLPRNTESKLISSIEALKKEGGDNTELIQRRLAIAVSQSEKVRQNLIDLRVRDLITESEFLAQRELLRSEALRQRAELASVPDSDTWFESLKMLIIFSSRALKWFEMGDEKIKREIINTVCSNPSLRDRKLSVQAKKPFRWARYLAYCPDLRTEVDKVRTDLLDDSEAFKEIMEAITSLSSFEQLPPPAPPIRPDTAGTASVPN